MGKEVGECKPGFGSQLEAVFPRERRTLSNTTKIALDRGGLSNSGKNVRSSLLGSRRMCGHPSHLIGTLDINWERRNFAKIKSPQCPLKIWITKSRLGKYSSVCLHIANPLFETDPVLGFGPGIYQTRYIWLSKHWRSDLVDLEIATGLGCSKHKGKHPEM